MTERSVATEAGRARRPAEEREIEIWDPLVRLFHWSLVGLFAFAFFTGEDWGYAHLVAGYGVAGLVAVRVIWGFVGPRHARFTDFVYRPSTVIGHLRDMVRLRARRYRGHSPAGGAMVIALLVMIALISLTGYMMTSEALWGDRWVEDLHEALVNLTVVLVALHIAGVVFASFEHGENLLKAMITGRKRG